MAVERSLLSGRLAVRSAKLWLVHRFRHLRLEPVRAAGQFGLVRHESTGAAVLEGAVALTEEPQLLRALVIVWLGYVKCVHNIVPPVGKLMVTIL